MNYWYSIQQRNNEAALHFLNRYVNYKDSLDLLQKESKEINIIEALEVKSKEDEVNRLKLTNKIARLYFWGIVFIAVVVALIAFLFYRSSKKEKQTNKLLSNLNNEIKQQQKDTAFAHEQALEANRDKDKILHVVAHDLRNPLTGIATLADLMLENSEDEKQQEFLQTISSSSKRATQLVNDLVSVQYHKTDHLDLATISLNKLLQEVLPLFQYKASEKNISLQLDLPAEEISIWGDWVKLERVVANLLHNAIKFSNNRGEVKLSLEAKANKAFISVADNGIGMSREMADRLMNTKTSIVRDGTSGEKGYGLGWNICKQIVEAHSGKLLVDARENQGTTVTIEIAQWICSN
jgi:signal transduction histidine kinase